MLQLARSSVPWLLTLLLGAAVAAPRGAGAAEPEAPDPLAQARARAETQLAVALRFRIEEQLGPAELALNSAATEAPGDRRVARFAGQLALQRGQLDTAAAQFGAITRLDPYGSEGYALLGMTRALQQQGADAVTYLGKALEMDRLAAAARLPLARLAREAGELERATTLLREVAAEDEADAALLRERTRVALAAHQPAVAQRHVEAWLQAAPDAASGRLLAAETLLGGGACDQALPRLREEAKARPRAEALRSLGWGLLLCGGGPAPAAGAFWAALRQDANDDGARVGLAWALMAWPEHPAAQARAAALLDDLLARSPQNVAALLARAELHRSRKELDAAQALLERVPPSHPARIEADAALARIALEREDPYTALRILEPLAQQRRDRPQIGLNLALAQVRAGRSAAARESVRSAVESLPPQHALRAHAQTVLDSVRRR